METQASPPQQASPPEQVSPPQIETYCLFCQTGYEPRVGERLRVMGYEHLVAQAARKIVRNGKEITEQRKLFLGYVFIRSSPLSADQIHDAQRIHHVIRMLRYEEGSYALSEKDRGFIQWLWQKGGVFDVSRALKEGDRIRIIDGPLKDYEGQIVQVNLKRKSVAVQFGQGSLLGKIWCSVEVVEGNEELLNPLT